MGLKKIGLYGVVFIVFLLATLPARVAIGWLPESRDVQVLGVDHSIWSGSAASIQVNDQVVNNIEWTINPLQLLLGGIGGTLSVQDSDISAEADWFVGVGGSISVTDVEVSLPAKRLQAMLPLKGVQLQGKLRATIASATFDRENGPQDVQATLFWLKGAASFSGPIQALGNFTVEATSIENTANIQLNLTPSKNVFDARGQATVNWPKEIALDISVTEQVPDGLKNVIVFLQKTEDNRRQLKMTLPLNR